MKTKQEILDNAPEWATHYLINEAINGEGYARFDGYFKYMCNEVDSSRYVIDNDAWQVKYCLADLRAEVKAMGIVDAVNYFRSEVSVGLIGDSTINYIYKGSVCGLFMCENKQVRHKILCSIDEYNNCLKELSEAAWMNDGEPQSYEAYKSAYSDIQTDENVEWKNGDECIVFDKEYKYVGQNPNGKKGCIVISQKGLILNVNQLEVSKPNKARDQKAKILYVMTTDNDINNPPCWGALSQKEKDVFYKLADKVDIK